MTTLRDLHVAADAARLTYETAVSRAYDDGLKFDAIRKRTEAEEAADVDAAIAVLDATRELCNALQNYLDSRSLLHFDEMIAAVSAATTEAVGDDA